MPQNLLHNPAGEGHWILLQQRIDRALWQWEHKLQSNLYGVTRFVIVQDLKRLDFDDLEEAENLFRMMDS